MNALRNRSPPVKLMLSIGGAGNDPNVFAKMSSSNTTRAIFIDSTIEVARNYGFDGVDLDWEFPGNDLDMLNLGWLYRQWRKALVHEARIAGKPRLLLTSAVYYAFTVQLDGPVRSYPSEAIRRYLDWISPMCFDYHGPWQNFTGPNSALFDPTSNFSTSYGIGSWIQSGVPARKVIMGLPLYGHTWTLKDPDSNGIGAPAIGKGPGDGTLTYDQILDFNSNNSNHAYVNFDNPTMTYYSYAGTSWVGYEDVGSIKLKIQFALSQGLGGYFFWALGQDRSWTISAQATKAWEE
ncbi:acidic mammalian chitinase-like [Tripterygium wilfordii]|uniref:Acidic mammalian chitinase-like n=1 Tax=Tripterygium wilfordii TaxID=458696 RepID=A0A7J7DPW7_TRIWF|nr:acidic mammalian chitinase-like [Tripterygium wilfordii]